MASLEFQCQSEMPISAFNLFLYHSRPGAFQRLMPPWEKLVITHQSPTLSVGCKLQFRIKKGPFQIPWEADHPEVVPGKMFTDIQKKGPFRTWVHQHRFETLSPSTSKLIDDLSIVLPGGWLGNSLGAPLLRRQLQKMFRFRHGRTMRDVCRQKEITRPLRIILVGGCPDWATQLAAFLSTAGHTVYNMSNGGQGKLFMHPFFDSANACHPLDECDALILTGVPLCQANSLDEPFPELAFLNRALRTLSQKPLHLLQIIPPSQQLPEWKVDPQLPSNQKSEKETRRVAFQNHLNSLEDLIPNVCRLHLGALIQPKPTALVQLLLQLESFLFLDQNASTANFHWISQDDLLGSILFLLENPQIQGDLAVIHPKAATRAELQQLLISTFFGRYVMSRIFQVVGWSAPGRSPTIHEHLTALPSIHSVGFVPETNSLKGAYFSEFGIFEP